MAAGTRTVWALDVGNSSLKALRLRQAGDNIEVVALDYIEHSKILSAGEISPDEKSAIIGETLSTFVGRNELGKDEVAISVPGQTSFARFIKLPPVEPKRIPEIVKFEAVQQIPFDINEVEWDWQLMPKADSPDTEVGIFAIKNELVSGVLESFGVENMRVTTVQMAPMALYNYAHFDRSDIDPSDKKAVVVLDMGDDNTNLVICTASTVWQRCIPLGGNAFTNAIAAAFKLDFAKAEKLKRSAPVSKYARQIFHAMKPVFTDFGAEVQRSLGYYSSSNRGVEFTKLVVLGGGFRLQGLGKYLQQSTQLPFVRPDSFEKLSTSSEVSSAKLHDNICDFGIVYGLGIQALGLAKVQSNLLPARIARAMTWARKSKLFYVAAAILLVITLMAFFRNNIDKKAHAGSEAKKYRSQTASIIKKSENASRKLRKEQSRASEYKATIDEQFELFKYRNTIPLLYETIIRTLPNAENTPSQADVYKAFEEGNIAELTKTPRPQRKQLFITRLGVSFTDSVATAGLDAAIPGGSNRQRRSSGAAAGGGADMGMGGMGMMGMGGMGGADFGPPVTSRRSSRGSSRSSRRSREPEKEEETTSKDGPGFVVVIEGYTTYKDIDSLMDPAGVGNNKELWGVVTRLMNLDEMVDGNSPFKLFDRENIEHFKRESGIVDLQDSETPLGIGIEEVIVRVELEEEEKDTSTRRGDRSASRRSTRNTADSDRVIEETVLIDPMTREEISKTFDIDENGRKKRDAFGEPVYIERDNWFRLKFKLLWKDAPAKSITEDD